VCAFTQGSARAILGCDMKSLRDIERVEKMVGAVRRGGLHPPLHARSHVQLGNEGRMENMVESGALELDGNAERSPAGCRH